MQPTHLLEIPVGALRKGHYVYRLDRPWADSPFLFQGFEIRTAEELEQLRRCCRTVQVQLSPEEADALRKTLTSAVVSGKPRPLTGEPSTWVGSGPVTDPVSMRTELRAATAIYDRAREHITQVLERLRRGANLDLETIEGVVDSMTESVFRNRDALSWLARLKSKDDYLYNHALSVSVWSLAFARHLGFEREDIRSLGIGGMLLDVGKTRISLELLHKSAPPTAAEWATLRAHVDHGLDILERDPNVTPTIRQMVASHHERMDGSGYPDGLHGEEIPMVARIVGIVDTYDAMISNRPYAPQRSPFDAIRELKALGKNWFQPQLVELFTQAVGVFPAGALVELNTGEVAVVVAINRYRRLRPQIMLVLDADKQRRSQFKLVDLLMHRHVDAEHRQELWIERGLPAGSYGLDPSEFLL